MVTPESYPRHDLPLAGFSVIEAEYLEEMVELVSTTPCAVARGVIEVRPLVEGPAKDAGESGDSVANETPADLS
ncbi:MAG: hypothetical protein GEU90_14305 [Gemmatimonas sp.]|nr:hypothetical protein [Gemmatimonas sp.]